MTNDNVSPDTWKRKDYLSARQTSANVTSYIFQGKEIDADTFLEYSGKVFCWLFQEQEKFADKGFTVEPTLTITQQKVKDAVEKKLGKSIALNDLYAWTESVGHEGMLPEKLNSVDKIVQFLV